MWEGGGGGEGARDAPQAAAPTSHLPTATNNFFLFSFSPLRPTPRQPTPHSPLPSPPTSFWHRNKVLASARCDEGFSLRDLIKPERARVLRVLSALVNLQKFKVEKLVWYRGQEEKKLEVVRRREAVEVQHGDLRRRAEAEKSLRDAEQPALAAAEAHKRELEHTRNALAARLEELRGSTKATKEELLGARDAAAALTTRVAELKAKAEATRGMIVSSPAKARAEVGALEEGVAGEQAALDGLDVVRRTVAKRLDVVAKAEKDVLKAITLMGESEVGVGVGEGEGRGRGGGREGRLSPLLIHIHTHTYTHTHHTPHTPHTRARTLPPPGGGPEVEAFTEGGEG